MSDEETTKDLVEFERQYWDAIKDKDALSVMSLSDDPTFVVGAQGVGELDSQTLATMLTGPSWDLTDYSLEDIHVRTVGDGMVVVAYKVIERLVIEGEHLTLEAFDSSVWVRRDGRWVCALHTESLAGDPFGQR